MTSRTAAFLVASSAFTGGLVVGLCTASTTGRVVCGRLTDVVRAQSRLFEARLHALQDQVLALERQVKEGGHRVTECLTEAGEGVLERYLPSLLEDPVSWEVRRVEMTRDLPHLPRA